MRNKKIKFKEIKDERDIIKICHSLWKLSIGEYKNNQIDSSAVRIISEAMKYRWYHCKLTGEISLEIYDELNSERKEDWKILYFAALTHDIKKFDHKHSKVGATWVKSNISKVVDIGEKDIEDINKLIRYHKTSLESDFIEVELGKRLKGILMILKRADNLSKEREKSANKL